MIVAERFIRSLVSKYGRHAVYTDGGTWYDEACNVLRLKHYLYSSFEKSLMERVNQYFKDGTESFDDYYSCMQNDYNLFHVYNWIQFFVSMYNDTTSKKNYFINELNDRGEYILAYEPEIIDEEKKIDFLVNNADYGLLGALEDISIEEAKK